MTTYDDALPLGEARALYFAATGLDEKGYSDRWVKLRAGPIALYFPNSTARIRAVRLHDLHHIVTGYDTTWIGEGEIAAFEIASGCADHYAAWYLNLSAFAIGLLISPRRIRRAFVRGRHSKNLYRSTFNESLLTTTVGAMRHRLGLNVDAGPTRSADLVRFAGWSCAAGSTFLLTAALVLAFFWLIARLVSGPCSFIFSSFGANPAVAYAVVAAAQCESDRHFPTPSYRGTVWRDPLSLTRNDSSFAQAKRLSLSHPWRTVRWALDSRGNHHRPELRAATRPSAHRGTGAFPRTEAVP